jgi:hypothetical protein
MSRREAGGNAFGRASGFEVVASLDALVCWWFCLVFRLLEPPVLVVRLTGWVRRRVVVVG